jgi:hypothetical protein
MTRAVAYSTAVALVLSLCGAGLLASTRAASGVGVALAATASPNPTVKCNLASTTTPVTRALLTSGMPCELRVVVNNPSRRDIQDAFDFYSWLAFLAVNSPANGGTIGADAPTVWESWSDLFSTMLPNGAPPPAFGSPVKAPAICPAGSGPVLQMIGKTPDTLEHPIISVSGQPLRTGPLIDQHGAYARYQIVLNEPMFQYIVDNKLYSKAVQGNFASPIVFPMGAVQNPTTGDGVLGAIVVKAAWKVLHAGDPADDPKRFHTISALVYTPADPNLGVKESCVARKMGLAGLHIVHKTRSDQQWIWTSFEHVSNVPKPADASSPSGHYNFFNPACPPSACPWNAPPPRPWNPSVEPFPKGFHSQIVRTTLLPDDAIVTRAKWNPQFRKLLAGTVWANYELVSTQWPRVHNDPVHPIGQPFPEYMANTTMETYVQASLKGISTPQSTSSCMQCHGNATTIFGRGSDFTFVLTRAH